MSKRKFTRRDLMRSFVAAAIAPAAFAKPESLWDRIRPGDHIVIGGVPTATYADLREAVPGAYGNPLLTNGYSTHVFYLDGNNQTPGFYDR